MIKKKYHLLTNEQRRDLCWLVHERGESIKAASLKLKVPYANAKAVSKTYDREGRTDKKPTLQLRIKRKARKEIEADTPSVGKASSNEECLPYSAQNLGHTNMRLFDDHLIKS